MRQVRMPNFSIVGAAKSGTSSLFHYLVQHPDIFIPAKKECRFFSEMSDFLGGPKGRTNWDDSIPANFEEYLSLFGTAGDAKAIGDVSPDYLYFYERSIGNIKKYLGENIKIIIILRNPVDRAYSHYLHYVRDGQETLSFEDALGQEESRIKDKWEFGWHYKNVSFYYAQTKAYLENFRQVKVYLYEDFSNGTRKLIKDMFEFLEVESSFKSSLGTKYNVSGVPRNKFLGRMILSPNPFKRVLKSILVPLLSKEKFKQLGAKVSAKALIRPEMNAETRTSLQSLFKDDIIRLQSLINRDLSAWLH